MGIEAAFRNFDDILRNKELHAFFQPIYNIESGRIIAIEALARIVKKDGNIYSPGSFFSFIEDSKDAVKLDWEIIEQSCKFLSELKRMGLMQVPLSLNLSKMHVFEPHFIQKLVATVDRYDIAHSLIHLELTEDTLNYFSDDSYQKLVELRDQGFKLLVDDFGLGMFSLNFIREVKIDGLKIDRSVIAGDLRSERDHIIVETMLFVGKRLGIDVTFEGIETGDQLNILRKLGCKQGQGFFYSKPISKENLIKLLHRK